MDRSNDHDNNVKHAHEHDGTGGAMTRAEYYRRQEAAKIGSRQLPTEQIRRARSVGHFDT